MTRSALLLAAVLAALAPLAAAAQQRAATPPAAAPPSAPRPPGATPAATPAKPEAAPQPEPPPAPYEKELLRLSEILGSLAFLRRLCGAADAGEWPKRMQALIESEGTSPGRRARLAGAYNRGYQSFALTYRVCTAVGRRGGRALPERGRAAGAQPRRQLRQLRTPRPQPFTIFSANMLTAAQREAGAACEAALQSRPLAPSVRADEPS